MAHYLIGVLNEDGEPTYRFVEASSAREAVARITYAQDKPAEMSVWVLRHGEPRHYTARTETKTIIEAERGE